MDWTIFGVGIEWEPPKTLQVETNVPSPLPDTTTIEDANFKMDANFPMDVVVSLSIDTTPSIPTAPSPTIIGITTQHLNQ